MEHKVTFIDTRNTIKKSYNFLYEHYRYQQGTYLQELQIFITGFKGKRFDEVTNADEKDCLQQQLLWELRYITDHCTSNITVTESKIIVSCALPLHINTKDFTTKEINQIESNAKLYFMQIDGIMIEGCCLLMVTDASTDESLANFRDTVYLQDQFCKMLGLQMSVKVIPQLTK